jgi:hypothetical protein
MEQRGRNKGLVRVIQYMADRKRERENTATVGKS